MMISRAQIDQVLKVYATQRAHQASVKNEVRAPGETVKDNVTLSVNQADISRVQELIAGLPDVRLEKVEAIAKEVQAGTYKIDPHQVADKMLGRLLADRLK